MITANTTPFCLSPLPLGTEIGCGAQSWFSGEGWGGRPLRRGPGEVGCPSDMPLLHCPVTSFPCQEAPPQAVAHDGLRAWDSTGQADLCSLPGRQPPLPSGIKTRPQRDTEAEQENQKIQSCFCQQPPCGWRYRYRPAHVSQLMCCHSLALSPVSPLAASSLRPACIYTKNLHNVPSH